LALKKKLEADMADKAAEEKKAKAAAEEAKKIKEKKAELK